MSHPQKTEGEFRIRPSLADLAGPGLPVLAEAAQAGLLPVLAGTIQAGLMPVLAGAVQVVVPHQWGDC